MLAIETVRRIDAIFGVECTINGLPVEQRSVVRQAQVASLVDDFQNWMHDVRSRMSRHADVAKAIDYMLSAGPPSADCSTLGGHRRLIIRRAEISPFDPLVVVAGWEPKCA